MSVMVPETAWNECIGAIMAWRHDYDRGNGFGGGVTIAPAANAPESVRRLYAASVRILNRGKLEQSNPYPSEAAADAQVRLYSSGQEAYARVMAEFRARRKTLAASFIEQCAGTVIKVDPSSLRETANGIEYTVIPDAPEIPKALADAVKFLMNYGNINRYAEDEDGGIKRTLATKASAAQIRAATLKAAQAGHFEQANHAALLLAQHYGYESDDVNPFPSTSGAPWVDVLPAPT